MKPLHSKGIVSGDVYLFGLAVGCGGDRARGERCGSGRAIASLIFSRRPLHWSQDWEARS